MVQLATAYEGHLGLWLRRWLKLPYVVYAHGNEILDAIRVKNWPKPLLALQRADRVLAVSQFTASLVQKAGVPADRMEIVYPGCDVDRFRPLTPGMELRQKFLGSRYRDRVVLTVGNLVTRKGHDMVVRALPRLLETIPDVTYLIIGDGPYRPQLEALTAAMGVGDRVIFLGKVSDRDLPDIYALSDVFVMPSRDQSEQCDVEGFGVVFLEASSCGKPVIGGRSGGIPEAVADGVTGLLVDPYDPEDIASALSRLLMDSELSTRLGRQGRLRVARDFTWERVGTQVRAILESIPREASIRS
jgi:phosphatidylinositol alpha-1,6-mannosyltransferase